MSTKQQIMTLNNALQRRSDEFRKALPDRNPAAVERFLRVAMTTMAGINGIEDCDQKSIMSACMRCAADGLLPDGREAAIVVYKRQVQYQPMVFGLIKLARQSGEIKSVSAHCWYENDHFDYSLGDEERINHVPAVGNRGKRVGAYAIIKLKDGGIQRAVLPNSEIEKVKATARAQNGPWKTHPDRMAEKTALRRALKWAPYSTQLDRALQADNETFDHSQSVTFVEPGSEVSRSDTVLQQLRQNDEPKDVEGEVLPPEGDGSEMTYKEVVEAMQAATTMDGLTEARDLGRSLDPKFEMELDQIWSDCRVKLQKGASK